MKNNALLVNIILFTGPLCIFFIFGEVLLRVIPMHGIITARSIYDPSLGYNRYVGQSNKYITHEGKIVVKKTNSVGYFDKEHSRKKNKVKYRIGFFGDSFVESLQVPLESTFFSLAEKKLTDLNVEFFAFGRSGYGTLHSYTECQRWANYYDLDLIVYVFCENDLGNQIKEIKRRPDLWYGELDGNGYKIQRPITFRASSSPVYRIMNYLKFHSILLTNISARLNLLFTYGIALKADEKARTMSTKTKVGSYPTPNDLPSSWPLSIREDGMKLGELIIHNFKSYVKKNKKQFAILYIPRESEFMKNLYEQDSWKTWLFRLCAKEDIDIIDPTDNLILATKHKGIVYYDHLTEVGHQAVSESFSSWFRNLDIKWKNL